MAAVSSTTTTTTVSPISNDIITKKIIDVNQNKLWQPVNSPTVPSVDQLTTSTAAKYEKQPAESIILENNAEIITTEAAKDNDIESKSKPKDVKPLWIPAVVMEVATAKSVKQNETIQPVDSTKSTGFESITKLPADITTPQDETVASSEINQTIIEEKPKITTEKYEITTIRFTYVPTETTESPTDAENLDTTTPTWNYVVPTRTKPTTIQDSPITTYRPQFLTTTEMEESSTIIPDTTPVLEVSSQIIDNATENLPETTTLIQTTTEEVTTLQTTEKATKAFTSIATTTTPIITTTLQTTSTTKNEPSTVTVSTTEAPEDTTTIVVQVVTEINTEKVTVITQGPTTTNPPTDITEIDCTSEEDSVSNEIIPETKSTEAATVEMATAERNGAQIIETTSQTPQLTTTQSPTTVIPIITTVPIIRVETTTQIIESTTIEATTESEEFTTKPITEPDEVTIYVEMTTEASSQVLPDEAGSGAAVAIAVSTIGVIALVLLIGLLVSSIFKYPH